MTEKETMPSGMIINRETDGLHVNRYEEAFSKFNLDLNDEGVSAAVKKLVDEKINEYDTDEVKRQLLGTVELTTLKETDSQESVMKFTEKVNDFADAIPTCPTSPPSACSLTTQESWPTHWKLTALKLPALRAVFRPLRPFWR